VFRAGRALTLELRDATVRIQLPVRLDTWNEPEPDIAVVRPRSDDYTESHPGPADILLLIEVADRSLPLDRNVKLPLYAASQIPEVWIVNLEHDVVSVCRDPRAGRYESVSAIGPGDALVPLAFADSSFPVSNLIG
jgi:Uma2 family endonuclease